MDADLWWLWAVRMLVGVGLFLGGYWMGRLGGMPRAVPWEPADLRNARLKIMAYGGPGDCIYLTDREMAAVIACSRSIG